MSVAVVFDSAGTLLHTYRVAKDVVNQHLLPGIETVTLTFSSPERVLVVIHVHSRDIIETPPGVPLARYLVDNNVGFGISCTRKVITAEDVGEVLYNDTRAQVGDLQDCIRNVWSVCKRESVVTMNSGVILNMQLGGIEFAVTTGGRPFEGAREAITELHRMGVPTYIASGDRVTKLEKMADYLGIPRDRVNGVATPTVKAQIVADLQAEYRFSDHGRGRDKRSLRHETCRHCGPHRGTGRRETPGIIPYRPLRGKKRERRCGYC